MYAVCVQACSFRESNDNSDTVIIVISQPLCYLEQVIRASDKYDVL